MTSLPSLVWTLFRCFMNIIRDNSRNFQSKGPPSIRKLREAIQRGEAEEISKAITEVKNKIPPEKLTNEANDLLEKGNDILQMKSTSTACK